jgi:hypothetical protein
MQKSLPAITMSEGHGGASLAPSASEPLDATELATLDPAVPDALPAGAPPPS